MKYVVRILWMFSAVLVGVTLCQFIYYFFLLTDFNPAHEKARAEYSTLHNALTLDMSRDEAKATFGKLAPKHLELFIDRPDYLLIRTPPSVGAMNWQMYVRFEKGRVIEIHSGSMNQYTEAVGAPPDKRPAGAQPLPMP